jgi:hypothetical protein
MVSPVWTLARAFGPMGASIVASAGDVLRFARVHVDRTPLLSQESVEAMQRVEVGLVDDSFFGGGWGLGWNVDRWDGVKVIGHDGNSIGQNAFMRIAPEERFGFCLQTNVESALNLYRAVAGWLFGERFGIALRPDPVVLDRAAVPDPSRYTGTYEREGLRMVVDANERGELLVTVLPTHDVSGLDFPPMENLPLQPVERDDSFFLRLPIADADLLAVFFDPDRPGGRPTYVHYGARAARRVEYGVSRRFT